jgi:hypothetical protein
MDGKKAAAGVRSELEGADKASGEQSRASRVIADLANANATCSGRQKILNAAARRSVKNRLSPEPFRKNVNPLLTMRINLV